MRQYQHNNLFVACPDVVGDYRKTLGLFFEHAGRIRDLGYPVALVGQDGLEEAELWPPADVLFIGGTTPWKMGAGAETCIKRAKELGMRVHVGRVNSRRRYRYFRALGAQSCDGTFVKFGGPHNWNRMKDWPTLPATE